MSPGCQGSFCADPWDTRFLLWIRGILSRGGMTFGQNSGTSELVWCMFDIQCVWVFESFAFVYGGMQECEFLGVRSCMWISGNCGSILQFWRNLPRHAQLPSLHVWYPLRLSLWIFCLCTRWYAKNVIPWGEVVHANLRRLRKYFAVLKKSATSCAVAFSPIMNPSSLKRAWADFVLVGWVFEQLLQDWI